MSESENDPRVELFTERLLELNHQAFVESVVRFERDEHGRRKTRARAAAHSGGGPSCVQSCGIAESTKGNVADHNPNPLGSGASNVKALPASPRQSVDGS